MENFNATLMRDVATDVQCDTRFALDMVRDRVRAAAKRGEMHCVIVTRFRDDVRLRVIDYLRRAGFHVRIDEDEDRPFGGPARSLRVGWA